VIKYFLIALLVIAALIALNYIRRRYKGTPAGKVAGDAYRAATGVAKKVMPETPKK